MKGYLKYLIITILLLTATGCSGNYNLNINEDLTVKEELNLTLSDESKLYSKTTKIFEEANIPKDNYDISISNGNIEIKYEETYSSIEDYILNSRVYRQLFNEIEYNITSDYIDLYLNESIKHQNNYTEINGTNLADLDVIQVNITNPFEVNFTNAEIINDNIYTWTIKKSDESKKFQMQFKPVLNTFPYAEIIKLIMIILCIVIISIIVVRRFTKSNKI